MSYLAQQIVNRRWRRIVIYLGAVVVGGALVLYGLSLFINIGIIEFVLAVLVVSVIGDFVLVWSNERSIADGTAKLHNEIVGKFAEADEDFQENSGQFKGKVHIGIECWAAISDSQILSGTKVRIIRRVGLVLNVEDSV